MTTPKHVSGTIKALEWQPSFGTTQFADAMGWRYMIGSDSDGIWYSWRESVPHRKKRADSEAAAKAAAQADYEARISAAIQPDPEPQPVAWRYRFSDPMSGRPVWRYSLGEWNGQKHSASEPLYNRPATPYSAGMMSVEAAEVIRKQGAEWTASAMILHIAETLQAKGKAVLTADDGDFGRQVLEYAAALRALAGERG